MQHSFFFSFFFRERDRKREIEDEETERRLGEGQRGERILSRLHAGHGA